ncbi:MAG: polysaccharide biosynthesis protein [Flavobacteriia bacterium]|nr:polysaccharide biosynthesis protein [Flavobacteriia bacterium]
MFQFQVNRIKVILLDIFISTVSLFLSYLVRFELNTSFEILSKEWSILAPYVLVFFVTKLLIFFLFNIHKGLIRHTSSEDIRRILFANTLCSLIFLIFGFIRHFYLDGYYLFPLSILIIDFLVSTFLLLTARFSIKFLYLESKKDKKLIYVPVLIYGTGVSGLVAKRTITNDSAINYDIIGFIDDNPKLRSSHIEGLRIYSFDDLEQLNKNIPIQKIIFAIQHPNEENKKKVIEFCLQNDISILQVPSAKKWVNGEFSTKQLSHIKIEDLLGRTPIRLSLDKMKIEFNPSIILVTGAAGSIGSGLVKELAHFNPKKMILLDQAESALFELDYEIKKDFPDLNYEIVIGDIRNYNRMERVFQYFKPNFVFHAAAYKHVPLMEDNPTEAIQTNVKGTKNLVDLSILHQVNKFVMISTDKAVNPTNVMGCSKRIAEIYAQSRKNTTCQFITTRFGNVLGSNGSVIPLFTKQIQQGGPITVTDEKITRFFMTIPEACQLVLEASFMGNGGDIFVFDMGKPVKIIDLARKMIKLSGLIEGKDIEIEFTGLRPGEKLYEELLSDEEGTIPTHHPQILIAKTKINDSDIEEKIDNLISLFNEQDNMKLVKVMKEIVPEYISNNSEFSSLDK